MAGRFYRRVAFPLLCRVDAEAVHHRTLDLLQLLHRQPAALALLERRYAVAAAALRTRVFGLDFANPVGLAAGFDKNAVAPDALAALGFGHVEVGTVTPRPQAGKARPRLFRLTEDAALINRLGFPNEGAAAVARRLEGRRRGGFVLGVNVGPNADRDSPEAVRADYQAAIEAIAPAADYLTINVSSPNTPWLRDLQAAPALDRLLGAVFPTLARLGVARPVLVKIAPDLDDGQLQGMLDVALAHPVAGIVATNTTLARPATLRAGARRETGGLSGKPLQARATEVIRAIYRRTDGRLPIVGAGGVFTVTDALEKLRAGASLLQLYTGLIYQGPAIARDINRGLAAYLRRHQIDTVAALVGQTAADSA